MSITTVNEAVVLLGRTEAEERVFATVRVQTQPAFPEAYTSVIFEVYPKRSRYAHAVGQVRPEHRTITKPAASEEVRDLIERVWADHHLHAVSTVPHADSKALHDLFEEHARYDGPNPFTA